MEYCSSLYGSLSQVLPFPSTVTKQHGNTLFFSNSRLTSGSQFSVNCRGRTGDDPLLSSSPYAILGVEPGCSAAELKAAFRAKVKQYHPDVNRGGGDFDFMIRRVIQAYE